MKFKRILSSALAVVMIFTAVAALLPVKASAAHSPSVGDYSNYSEEDIQKIVAATYSYNFNSAEEMLEYEMENGYIDYVNSEGNTYTFYINRFTGVVYYRNNLTGQMLTSNPYNPGYGSLGTDIRSQLMSQIIVEYAKMTNSNADEVPFYSATMAAERAQIKVTAIAGGFRVSYTLGDMTKYLAPRVMTYAAYEEKLFIPMLTMYAEILEEYIGEYYPDEELYFFGKDEWDGEPVRDSEGVYSRIAFLNYSYHMVDLYSEIYSYNSDEYKYLEDVKGDITDFRNKYQTGEGDTYMHRISSAKKDKQIIAEYVMRFCPDYTFQDMYADEAECNTKESNLENEDVAMFRCALEYTMGADGTLSVRLPANSISFDETKYVLKGISTLQYFGCGDLNNEGYVFIPDGSGAVIDFEDFYSEEDGFKPNLTVSLGMYGKDYCHSSFSGVRYAEQVTLPIYGIVTEGVTNSLTKQLTGKNTAKVGYFAIIESGASLSSLRVAFGGTTHKFGSVYTSVAPYPCEKFETSADISVGSNKSYTMVSEARYNGSFVTKYTMLSDENAAVAAGTGFYPTSYVGMATCYRDYLKSKGELTALQNTEEDLPLYIEALGSMEIVKKILTFPVTVSIPLTTFDDIVAMYDDFANAKQRLYEKYEEYQALADAESKSALLKEKYQDTANRYYELYLHVDNITNINFKLTGFANGGMYFTYPTKVRWEKECGGSKGFERLLAAAADRSNTAGNSFGVYPEFDFQYINNTALFDGISNRNTVSRMLDNRYASKQAYNSVLREYESIMAMVISPDSLDRLYTKFLKQYSKYDVSGISVSTLGSDLNSNFDEDNSIIREDAIPYVRSLLGRISGDYDLLLDKGNAYSLKYADHIINISIDSSHLRNSSYTIPFIGMVLHGYVNYAGSPLNYSGSPDYELLRSIENGASLYYILCYQNTNNMKDDATLNDYYSVKYETWFERIVEEYDRLNKYIGGLQTYEIADHTTLIAEKVVGTEELLKNNEELKAEFLELVESQLYDAISATIEQMQKDDANIGKGLKVEVDTNALLSQAANVLRISVDELVAKGFNTSLDAIKAKYEAEYPGKTDEFNNVTSEKLYFAQVEYTSKHAFYTDSFGDADGYIYSDYTVDNDLVVMVTYRKTYTEAQTGRVVTDEVKFILNYNIYAVNVKLSDGNSYQLDKYGIAMIDLREA